MRNYYVKREYGIKWFEFAKYKNNVMMMKVRWFRTKAGMELFINRLKKRENFIKIYSHPYRIV